MRHYGQWLACLSFAAAHAAQSQGARSACRVSSAVPRRWSSSVPASCVWNHRDRKHSHSALPHVPSAAAICELRTWTGSRTFRAPSLCSSTVFPRASCGFTRLVLCFSVFFWVISGSCTALRMVFLRRSKGPSYELTQKRRVEKPQGPRRRRTNARARPESPGRTATHTRFFLRRRSRPCSSAGGTKASGLASTRSWHTHDGGHDARAIFCARTGFAPAGEKRSEVVPSFDTFCTLQLKKTPQARNGQRAKDSGPAVPVSKRKREGGKARSSEFGALSPTSPVSSRHFAFAHFPFLLKKGIREWEASNARSGK